MSSAKALLVLVAAVGTSGVGLGQQAPRNVLMIAVDDLKPVLHCYGDEHAQTPNIDALAAEGTLFANAHCQQAVCGPTRASLLCGLRPDTTRVFDLKTRIRDILPNVVTLPQHFQNNGYETVGIGKVFDPRTVDGRKQMDRRSWSQPYLWPTSKSDSSFGYLDPALIKRIQPRLADAKREGIAEWEQLKTYLGCRMPTDMAEVTDEAYNDGVFAAEAVKQINQLAKGDKPFFLAVGFQKPHLPFCAPKKYWDLYDRAKLPLAANQKMPEGSPEYHFQDSWELRSGYDEVPAGPLPEAYQRNLVHGYYACVSYVDAQIGKVVAALEAAGVADETVIVLWGDHGWHLGDHGMWCKHTNYEQATRVPLIISAPGQRTTGGRCPAPVEFLDVFPTLCATANVPVIEGLQGVSLQPVLDDPTQKVKEVAISQYPRNNSGEDVMGYSFRNERYRLTQWISTDQQFYSEGATPIASELFDYETDPNETRNLISDPQAAEALKALEDAAHKYFATRVVTKVEAPTGDQRKLKRQQRLKRQQQRQQGRRRQPVTG